MRVLLDTNILLRALAGDPLVENISDVLLAEDTEVYVSAVSWWDIAARIASGNLEADLDELREAAAQSGFLELPLHGRHVRALAGPADSFGAGLKTSSFALMIAAQAEAEPMHLVSSGTTPSGRAAVVLREWR
ncbi:MAG: PIN domain-containing protein [Desulfovibrio sp.]|jgi:PIN domain nuclease of toxin-antitoxin system|nr:PIN domain-containing protein [Desulfovibrio sp.]